MIYSTSKTTVKARTTNTMSINKNLKHFRTSKLVYNFLIFHFNMVIQVVKSRRHKHKDPKSY